jgi:hypothetical protein
VSPEWIKSVLVPGCCDVKLGDCARLVEASTFVSFLLQLTSKLVSTIKIVFTVFIVYFIIIQTGFVS